MTSRVFATVWLGLAVFAGQAHAQTAVQPRAVLERVDKGSIEKIREEGLNRSHIPEDTRYLTDVIGPRLMKTTRSFTAMRGAAYRQFWSSTSKTVFGTTT